MVEQKRLIPEKQKTEVEGNSGFVWENVFLAMTDLAKKRKQEVTLFAPRYNFDAIESNSEYDLRINPADANNGNLETMVIDIYCDGVHSQQCVVKAVWEQGKPKVTKIDNSAVDNLGKYFMPEEIAKLSENLIKINMYKIVEMNVFVVGGRNFAVSTENYSNLIH